MTLRIKELITSFKKSLLIKKAQSILEYSLLLVVIAILSLAIIWPYVKDGQNNIFSNVVDKINQRVLEE